MTNFDLHHRAVLARLAGWPVKTIAVALRVSPDTVRAWLRRRGYSITAGWQRGAYILSHRGAHALHITPEDARRMGATVWDSGSVQSADTPRRVRGIVMRPGPGMHTAWTLLDDA